MVGVALWTALPAPVQAAKLSDELLSESFRRVVFKEEFSSSKSKKGQIKRYVTPVRFYIDNRAKKNRTRAVSRFVLNLNRLIEGLETSIVSSRKDANFTVFVVDRADYANVVRSFIYRRQSAHVPGKCLVHVRSTGRGIYQSTAVIVSDEGRFLFQRCLTEEILQGLGPLNDDDSLKYSVFNDRSTYSKFTKHDRYLMNMLYHPAIRPGMREEEAMKLLPQVLQDVRRRLR